MVSKSPLPFLDTRLLVCVCYTSDSGSWERTSDDIDFSVFSPKLLP